MSNTKLPELLRRVAHELRTYNPAADEYKGQHIHGVWAREIDAVIELLGADRERQAGEAVAWQHKVPKLDKDGNTIGWSDWKDGRAFACLPHRPLFASLPVPQAVQAEQGELCDALRRALEIIAVGDAQNPQTQAAEELIALGIWRDIPEARAAAPSPDGKPEQIEGTWHSHGANDSMRHPEESDLIGGETDMPSKAEEAEAPSADDAEFYGLHTKQVDALMQIKYKAKSLADAQVIALEALDHRSDLLERATQPTASPEQAEAPEHDLYTDADKDRPEVICDRNGQVTLGLCKRCGKGEAELEGPCVPKQAEAPSDGDFMMLDDEGKAMMANSHHYTVKDIRALIDDLKAVEQGTEQPEWINRDHRTRCGVIWRVIAALASDVPVAPLTEAERNALTTQPTASNAGEREAELNEEIERLQTALSDLADRSIYRGNSVSFIYQKADAYKAALLRAFGALAEFGFKADGQTELCDVIRAALASKPPAGEQKPVLLNIIRKWPEGFEARIQHVWKDVLSFTPNVKLWDLQRTLAEFGFTMLIYEGGAPEQVEQKPVASIYVTPGGEREFDDWKCALPVGRNLLYPGPQPDQVAQDRELPEFDELPDEAIDDACAAGASYRVDLMRAWNAIRAARARGEGGAKG